jgi:hypothetical protein
MPTSKPEVPADADDPAESQRFIDMAREIGIDESPEAFQNAFKKIVRPKQARKAASPERVNDFDTPGFEV